ncbi:Hemolysin-type calcium-binding protein [Pseudooceanicola batsensis HTCC2597]|uniref:Hemolysin-type calcium-binding protein n=1 Tax=Pseudooceanicola batsensis (strain ATCC BAA-863 / DSM 15984 / KCTC 12145 / HTCC2597) TaxID=252305 RepID=A3TUQ7_PSEBH|nr:hemolysin-type calcium-binding protein [Pseudooceanicola batsensis]EAQ04253.1 Hemolysin-type calcium-binding protein [Pseudooceanicola batsensis HTCC2597]
MTDIYAPTSHDSINLVELELYHLLMNYRATEGLAAVPLSVGLSATAGRHAVDTHDNIWAQNVTLPEGANLHSWSDAYYYSDHRDPTVMWDAPSRIGSSYTDSGYEISAAGFATIEAALSGWQGSPGHNSVIMNEGSWSSATWNAIGVGVIQSDDPSLEYNGRIYHVWFGQQTDPSGVPIIEGTTGDDDFVATSFADIIQADLGNDTIDAGAGDDMIDGGSGSDSMDGGAGDDTVTYENAASGAMRLSLGGTAGVGGQSDGDVLTNIEHAIGSNFADTIIGSTLANTLNGLGGADLIFGNDGADTIDGGDGDDALVGGGGADNLIGGAGIDTARYAGSAAVTINLATNTATGGEAEGDTFSGIENLVGSQNADILTGDANANRFEGLGGDDVFQGGLGADTMIGHLGIDTADYSDSASAIEVGIHRTGVGGTADGDVLIYMERIIGSAFGDDLVGGGTAPIIEGAGGNDTIIDYGGAATIMGGDGDDTINAGTGADSIDGGAGIDTVRYANTSAVQIDLAAGTGSGFAAEGDIFVNVENVVGSNAGDTLTGDDQANRLEGLYGEDTIKGGLGNDVLLGGGNADTFVFDAAGFGRDLILDWQDNYDKIDLRGSGLTHASFTEVDTAQGVRLDYFNGVSTDAIHLFGASLSPSDIDSSDFLV